MDQHAVIEEFNRIYEATNKKIVILITVKCSNPVDISDIFQETYMEIFSVLSKKGHNYIENEEAFVINIAKKKIYKHYSLKDRLKKFVSINYVNDDGDEIEVYSNADTNFSIEDDVINKEFIAEINKYLITKSVITRKIFYLYYSLELTISEIAKELDLSESNVKNKIYRTLSEIRNKFKI